MKATRYTIVYEDDWLMVLDKPSGMLVIPTPKREKNALTDLLNHELDERGIEANAHPCHRLDRDTSGLIIYAKGKKAQGLMMDEFRQRAVKKIYVAFVHGAAEKKTGVLRRPIYNRNKNRNEDAETRYRVLSRRREFSVLEVEPVTGRTNQIRIHMKEMGHPLVGERVYAFGKDYRLKFRRPALHAHRVEFTHPVTKERMAFSSPLPSDMAEFLKRP